MPRSVATPVPNHVAMTLLSILVKIPDMNAGCSVDRLMTKAAVELDA
jgi:hypothetical protein